MARILRTPQADADLEEIWSYIAQDNVAAADELIRKCNEMMQRLAQTPGMGFPQFQYGEGLRCKPVAKRYLIFYQPCEDGIQVIRVLHGARKWEELL